MALQWRRGTQAERDAMVANDPLVGEAIYTTDTERIYIGDGTTAGGVLYGGAGSDTSAVHDDVAAEISAITAKATPTTSDFLLIEDAADSNNKKRITIGDLPASAAGVEDDVYGAGWNGDTTNAPSQNAVYDKIDAMDTAIAANTDKETNATHTGDVTGDTALTIAAGAVDIAMLSATGTPGVTTYLRGDNTWTVPAGSGDVTKVGTPVNDQVGVWTGDGTIEGTTGLTYSGTALDITGDITVSGTVDGVDIATAVANKAGTDTVAGSWTFNPNGTGGLTDYDIEIGDTDGTPTYGMMQIGNATFGRTSYNAAALDLDGSVLLWNNGTPATSNIEFAFAESTNSIRFAIPQSGAGNGTYNPRSMIIAGPAPVDDTMVTVGYWQGQGIFDNLAMDTGTTGADLGVQNDLEVEGTIDIDDIAESTAGHGVAVADNLDVTGNITVSGTVDGIDIATDVAANTLKETNATHTGDVTGDTALTIAAGAVDIAMMSATGTPGSGNFLRGDNTWSTPAGSGDVTKVGTPINDQIGVWTGDGTLEGDADFTYNSITSVFNVEGDTDLGGNLTVDGTLGINYDNRGAGYSTMYFHDGATWNGDYLRYYAAGATFEMTSGLALDGTLDVTGDILVSGTVDGVDIAARDHAELHTVASHSDTTATGAELNTLVGAADTTLHYHAADRARAVHTGTQTASTISDFDTEVGNHPDVTANTAHTALLTTRGDVLRSGLSGPERLALGTNGQVLTSDGTDVAWGTPTGTGDVVGPASAVDNRIATFDTTTGKLIQDSGTLVSDLAASSHTHAASDLTAGTFGGSTVYTFPDDLRLNADLFVNYLGGGTASISWFHDGVANNGSYLRYNHSTNRFEFSDPLNVTGDITVSGTVDGIDIATDVAANTAHSALLTTRGDVLRHGVSAPERLALGTSGQVLTSDGTDVAWASPAGGGNVSNTGTPLDNQVGVWTDATTVEGTTGLTYDGVALDVTGNITVSGTVDGIDIATDVAANTLKLTNATHTGDVTGSGALTIADDAVTYAKMQNVVADERLLGNIAGADQPVVELTQAQVLTFLGTGVKEDRAISIQIDDPVATNDFRIASLAWAGTITRIHHMTDVGTVDWNLEERAEATPATTGTNVFTSDEQSTSTSQVETSFANASLDQYDGLYFRITSVASTPTKLWITIYVSED